MKRINEIFYSLQGEGRNTGRAAAFVRFSGCNLKCPFCDTDFSSYTEMTDDEILSAIRAFTTRLVVLTGGEPSLQVNDAFVELLHANGYEVAIETNGTRPVPAGIDWVTVSPKGQFVGDEGRLVLDRCNELKCLFDGKRPVSDFDVEADYRYLQPCDVGDSTSNRCITAYCISYVKTHPRWRLSLQTHKLIGFK